MARPRYRNDLSPTVYHVMNSLVGEPGELCLDKRQMTRLSLIIRQAARLFCVKVISFTINPTGYSLVCSAPAELPTHDDLRDHFLARYGDRREIPDFDDPDVYKRWATRLRDFSCLVKDIQQRFTQWYNCVVRHGKRKGTLWKGRFQSHVLKTAKQTLTTVKKTLSQKGINLRPRKIRHQRWRKLRQGCSFLLDTGLSTLAVPGGVVALAAYVLLDEFSRFPQTPFPIKLLRDIVDKTIGDGVGK